jgi:2,3-dihydroxybenzoate decarboxylase
MQDARSAADELERCIRELRFCGAMINGHTHGQYLDDDAFHPFWERADELGAVIYLHPADPVAQPSVLSGYKVLMRPMWGWGFETGSHALRLVVGGHFDRFPRSRLMLGHLGETLPFLLWRFDSRAQFHGLKLKKPPSEYIRENVIVTTSGMCSAEPLKCTLAALGQDRVMFGADHPFESAPEAGEFLDHVPLADELRADVAFNNAVKHLGLPKA